MTRTQLEHIIRAAGAITNAQDLVVIGSQAVLGQFPGAPAELLVSDEADIFPRTDPGRGDLIDGSIGEDSPFHRTFGYYAHGVDETTAILPEGWRREKDLDFTSALARHGMVDRETLEQRLAAAALDAGAKSRISAHIRKDFTSK